MIPLATTTISVKLPDPSADPYDSIERNLTTVVSGVAAHFSAPSGRDQVVGGDQSVVEMRLSCDPCGLTPKSVVVDESTSEAWRVVWVRLRSGLGLTHVEAGVARVVGVVPS